MDNIPSDTIYHEVISGNITATISDHLFQFLFARNVVSKNSFQKSNIYERDCQNLFKQNFHLTILIKIYLMLSN